MPALQRSAVLALLGLLALPGLAPAGEIILQPVEVAETKALFGQIESRFVVPARSRIGGTITALNVTEGDEVDAGQVIARIVDEKLESLREATADDMGGILQLIEPYERDGTLVKRDRTEIERDIAQYSVIEHDGVIFGCAALYPYPEAKTAEMAALTVSPQSQGQGDGEKVLKRIEQRARAMGLKSIFVLTTRTMHWFIKRGFAQVDPDWLPEARKRKYNWDRKSQVLVKKL
jgi:amino-acid N-acetyltransferase